MREKLQLYLQEKQYKDILARYHFEEHDLELLKQVGGLVEKKISPTVYYEVFVQDEENGEVCSGKLSSERLAVIVTLGIEMDELQNRYMHKERLSESYMAECVGMELLRAAYEQAAERIHAHTGKWISDFQFVGDKIPFSRMEEIFRLLAPQEVSYNQAYMLTPKKTVVFLTALCEERKNSYCHVCADCGYMACPSRVTDGEHNTAELGDMQRIAELNRNLTYGYQKIFGKKDDKYKDVR